MGQAGDARGNGFLEGERGEAGRILLVKFQITNSKIQINFNNQISNSKHLEFRLLEFSYYLELVFWSLEFI